MAASTSQALEPGVIAEASIQFLVPDIALPKFKPGVQFTIWEGRDVGTGEVLSTLDPVPGRTRDG